MDDIGKLIRLQSQFITGQPAIFKFTADDKSMLPDGFDDSVIKIYPLKVGTVIRVSGKISEISDEDLETITAIQDVPVSTRAYVAIGKYSDTVIDIICLGIHNQKSAYPEYLHEFIKENCTHEDLFVLLNAVLYRMGTMSFINSTTEMKKVGLQNMEIIAMRKNLESWAIQN